MTTKKSDAIKPAASNIIVTGTEDAGNYLVLKTGIDEIKSIMLENMGTEGLEPHELDRAENPSGKVIKWTIPDESGEDQMVGEIQGVILYNKFDRNLWEKPYGKGELNARPICSSIDGVTGVGDPGGICDNCPYSKFGSGPNNSQRCKLTRHLFVLREDELLPLLVVITASSLKNVKTYFRRLMSKQKISTNVITTLKLTGPHKSKSGYDHARAELYVAGDLDDDTADKMKAYSDFLRPWLSKTRTLQQDLSTEEGIDSDNDVSVDEDEIQDPDF